MSELDAFFPEVIAYALLEEATKTSCRGKISENLAYQGYFSEEKTEDYD